MGADKLKCPQCGATEIAFSEAKGSLVCDFCGCEFNKEVAEVATATALEGVQLGPGVTGELPLEEGIETFACPSCKAEMTLNYAEYSGNLQCHWCRHVISITDKKLNGCRPDGVIEFEITKEAACKSISAILAKRKTFASKNFIKTFSPEFVAPVYLPYFIVDLKGEANYSAKAGITKSVYEVNDKKRYNYELYDITRKGHIELEDLIIEANSSYFTPFGADAITSSKNIINSILPFDISKAKPYSQMYFNGDYRAEFRNMKLEECSPSIEKTIDCIAKHKIAENDKKYTHGIQFEAGTVTPKGTMIYSILAPVWLYSHMESGKKNYVAVNGQTGETAICVPVNKAKLISVCVLIEIATILGLVAFMFGSWWFV